MRFTPSEREPSDAVAHYPDLLMLSDEPGDLAVRGGGPSLPDHVGDPRFVQLKVEVRRPAFEDRVVPVGPDAPAFIGCE